MWGAWVRRVVVAGAGGVLVTALTVLPVGSDPHGMGSVSARSAGDQANGWSRGAEISADGWFVAFHSAASNLVAEDTNGEWDVFVHDRQTGATTRVSVGSDAGR